MASCAKHEFILSCADLIKGERNIDIDNLLTPIFESRNNGVLYYDIVCKYAKGAKVNHFFKILATRGFTQLYNWMSG